MGPQIDDAIVEVEEEADRLVQCKFLVSEGERWRLNPARFLSPVTKELRHEIKTPTTMMGELLRINNPTKLIEAIEKHNWTDAPDNDLLDILRLLISKNMAQAAMQFAQRWANLLANNSNLQQAAKILAPPTVRHKGTALVPDLSASIEWMRQHAAEYHSQWIAVENGERRITAESLQKLEKALGPAQLAVLVETRPRLKVLFSAAANTYPPTTEQAMSHQAGQKTNRLVHERSPYLLQHAHNPVDWFPWGAEAFEKAARENLPIFLSIGYATCHWCHVMERESFEDPMIADLLNDAFVNIKVDREERPDIDHIYMAVCQMMTGSGGWPLTILMTPDKMPFFAATFIPKENRYGLMGMLDLIPRIKEMWRIKRNDLITSADQIVDHLCQYMSAHSAAAGILLEKSVLDSAYQQLKSNYDTVHGGFGRAPKFPTPHQLMFLLRYWQRSRDEMALEMVERTLQAMCKGGIYDHVGFGFHRYSTDSHWLLPHFEKMLYDQAMLLMAYTEAYQATAKPQYAQTAREIATYVLRDMTAPEGGFYSAEDADSEGVEGKFYVWRLDEVNQILAADDAKLMIEIFNLESHGNFHDEAGGHHAGLNIFHLQRPLAEWARIYQQSEADLTAKVHSLLQKLFEVREKRIHPQKDDKILTDWNGLMIAALAKAGRVLSEPAYTAAAQKAAHFVSACLQNADGRLWHRYRAGSAGLAAHVDDYAFMLWGCLELYEATFAPEYLTRALELNTILMRNFWDNEHGGFYFTADDSEALLVRSKEFYDGAAPSGNAVALLNLLRLARITGNVDYDQKAGRLISIFAEAARYGASAYTQFMIAADFALGPAFEIVIVGDLNAADTQAMLKALQQRFIPNKVLLHRPDGKSAGAIGQIAPFVETQTALDNKATAYICQNFACRRPTNNLEEMLALLDGGQLDKKNLIAL